MKIDFIKKLVSEKRYQILNGIIIVIIIFLIIDIFFLHLIYSIPAWKQELPQGQQSAQEETVPNVTWEDILGQGPSSGWDLVASFDGEKKFKSSSFYVPADVIRRIVLHTQNYTREGGLLGSLDLFVYNEDLGQKYPSEHLIKNNISFNEGVTTDIVELCDRAEGYFVIEIESENLRWKVSVETL